jgi:hypothetical protein
MESFLKNGGAEWVGPTPGEFLRGVLINNFVGVNACTSIAQTIAIPNSLITLQVLNLSLTR